MGPTTTLSCPESKATGFKPDSLGQVGWTLLIPTHFAIDDASRRRCTWLPNLLQELWEQLAQTLVLHTGVPGRILVI